MRWFSSDWSDRYSRADNENNKDNYPLIPYGSPPSILIVSPQNKTYTIDHVYLTFTMSEPTSWIGCDLDGQANITIAEKTSLSGLSNGSHRLRARARVYF